MTAPAELRDLLAKVDFALVNVPGFDAASGHLPVQALDLRLAELTASFTMETFGLALGEIGFAESHDAALAQGTKDFCLIQKIGHLIQGPPAQLARDLLGELAACAFLTGHIMERGGYYYLHDQCVLVNRRAWERLGRPAFGTPTGGPQHAAVPRRSPDNVHDDYTPLFLDPTSEERVWQGAFGYGWHAISASLRGGLRVNNWGAAARAWKRNCYAYYGDPAAWQRALADVTAAAPTADDGLNGIIDFLKAAPRRASHWRGADLLAGAVVDVPNVHICAGLDCVLAPARGFEMHQILARVGFHAGTRLVHYDADDAVLAVQRRLIANWDGLDMSAAIALIRAEVPDVAGFDERALGETLGRAIARFGTAAAWRDHWQRYRALTHQFVIADPVADPEVLGGIVRAQGALNVLLSLGDHFNGFAALARFDGARRRKAYDVLLAAMKSTARRYLLLGQPPLVRIRGI